MDSSKIKNFIIAVLLLLNAFLLLFSISDGIARAASDGRRRQELLTALSSMGITIRDESVLSMKPNGQTSLIRDLAKEKADVRAVLGAVEVTDLGGNFYLYESEKGKAQFRSTGEFVIIFNDGVCPAKGGFEAFARSFMKKIGLKPDKTYCVPEDIDGGHIIELRCEYDSAPVYNCTVRFTFSEKELLLVSGTRILDKKSQSAAQTGDIITALVSFLGQVRVSGKVCSEITGVYQGYESAVSVSGESRLTPVWRIETDAGEFTVE
jgi:regulatory protein YycI of two-component signal transduction system YycFG